MMSAAERRKEDTPEDVGRTDRSRSLIARLAELARRRPAVLSCCEGTDIRAPVQSLDLLLA